ncbi:resolvase [Sphingobium quisquiliarum P25]|uniref:Resolvase n=1 Tax=Sphingobium quisquiliarum P25 TaxID=1329909 RepID=T0GTJ4_9SPHN|nr:resolvase [Sphingobium quisquiliarum P25]
MLIGYARVSKADGSQSLDLQHDALRAAGVEPGNIYDDRASGSRDDRPGLAACLKSLRDGDVLIVWKLDRLGRTLTHLVSTVQNLSDRGIGLRVLTGKGAQIDTTTPSGRMVFGIFAALLQRLAAVRGRLSLCADQAAAAKWWLSMPMASVSAEGPMPKALSTRRTSPLMPGCRHQGRACPLRRARMTSNPLIVA